MEKGKIAHNEQFLLFPQYFSTHLKKFLPFSSNLKLLSANSFSLEESKNLMFGKGLTLRLVQTGCIFRRQRRCDLIVKIYFGKGIKHGGKKRKCWLPASTMFSEGFFFRVFENRPGGLVVSLSDS